MSNVDKLHWRRNLATVQENDSVYLVPWNHLAIWENDHKDTIKHAASVVVIEKGVVIKNVLYKAYEG